MDLYAQNIYNLSSYWLGRVNILKVLTIIAIAYILIKLTKPIVGWATRRVLRKDGFDGRINDLEKIERQKRAKTISSLFSFIIKIFIAVTAIYTVLISLGLDLTPLLASVSIAGIAVGIGAQQLIRDVLAGFFVILENQYRVGDTIRLSGIGFPSVPVEGRVRSITLRKTTLRDRDGNVHIVANGSIYEVINRTLGYSKFRFMLAVSVDTDIDKLATIINKSGEEMSRDHNWSKIIVDAPHYDEFGAIDKDDMRVSISGTTAPGEQWKVGAEFRKRLFIDLKKSDIQFTDIDGFECNQQG